MLKPRLTGDAHRLHLQAMKNIAMTDDGQHLIKYMNDCIAICDQVLRGERDETELRIIQGHALALSDMVLEITGAQERIRNLT